MSFQVKFKVYLCWGDHNICLSLQLTSSTRKQKLVVKKKGVGWLDVWNTFGNKNSLRSGSRMTETIAASLVTRDYIFRYYSTLFKLNQIIFITANHGKNKSKILYLIFPYKMYKLSGTYFLCQALYELRTALWGKTDITLPVHYYNCDSNKYKGNHWKKEFKLTLARFTCNICKCLKRLPHK